MQPEHISYTSEQSELWGDVLREISYYTGAFPERALQELIENPEEATKLLLYVLNWAKEAHPDIPDSCTAHLYALYILAQFREKSAYPLILELFVLASGEENDPLSAIISFDGAAILTSVYDGNVDLLKELIIDEDCAFCARQEAYKALIMLSQRNLIDSSVVTHIQDQTLFATNAVDTDLSIDNALESIQRLPWFQVKKEKAPGRNDPCPCGSGKKYKKCCL